MEVVSWVGFGGAIYYTAILSCPPVLPDVVTKWKVWGRASVNEGDYWGAAHLESCISIQRMSSYLKILMSAMKR